MTPRTQTITAERKDGHSAAGLPGNCLQAAVASLLDLELDEVPHFALFVDWFAAMRRWARERDGDFTYFPAPGTDDQYAEVWERVVEWGRGGDVYVILGGPSPRGPFGHVVVGNVDLEVVHDPHPSRAGLVEVEDAIVYCAPYDPAPVTLALEAGAA